MEDEGLNDWIKTIISEYVDSSEENRLGDGFMEKAWGSPLVGFPAGTIRCTAYSRRISAIFCGHHWRFFR